MATAVLHPDPQRFPAGATVKAYKRSNFPGIWDLTGAPQGTQDASATVASDGSVTFTGLTDATAYVIYAASPDRYASFQTPAAASAGSGSVGGASDVDAATAVVDGNVLYYDSASGKFKGAAPALNIVNAKGDLIVGTADNVVARRAVGSDGQVLTADSAQTDGIKWADAASSVLGLWQPSLSALKAVDFDPALAVSTITLASGWPHMIKVPLETPGAVSNVLIYCSNTSGALTTNQCFMGVYSSAGTLLGKTADLSSGVFNTTGLKTLALTAEAGQSLPSGAPGTWVHVVLLLNGTMPQTVGLANPVALNAGIASPTTASRAGHNGSGGLTSLPSSRPSMTLDTTRYFWVGLS